MSLILKTIIDTIVKYKNIVIISHVNPDGDALGSSLALYLFSKKIGANPKVIIPNDYPSFLSWMPSIQDVIIYDRSQENAKQIMSDAELFCYLDFNTESRTGVLHNDLCHFSKTPKLLIDHHIGADLSKFEASISITDISSTSEIVAELIKLYGFEKYLDDDIASCLLTGLITDTGSFTHSIFKNTFNICGEIISSTNVNYMNIHQNIYDNSSLNNDISLLNIPSFLEIYIELRGLNTYSAAS